MKKLTEEELLNNLDKLKNYLYDIVVWLSCLEEYEKKNDDLKTLFDMQEQVHSLEESLTRQVNLFEYQRLQKKKKQNR